LAKIGEGMSEQRSTLTESIVLVTILRWEVLLFGDEAQSRRRFAEGNPLFCRRDRISSPFFAEKSSLLATRPNLVAFLRWEIYFFVDEPESRHLFAMGNLLFCRRA